MGSAVLQYGHCSSDTAHRRWAGRRLDRRWVRSWVRRTRAERTGGRAWGARAGAAGSWARGLATGCVLGALDLFLIRIDSVLFMSRFLDIVREPGS